MFSEEIKQELACELVDYIENEGIQDYYLCDIAYYLYNTDYYIIGIHQAKQWLKKYFDDVLETIEYWEDELGTVLKVTDVEKLATTVAYTVAENILNNIYYDLDLNADEKATEEEEQLIKDKLIELYY